MQKTNKLNRLVYAEDVLKNIYRERVYMGDVGYIHAKAAVNECPTVDAVEVVRCRDCKHCMMCYPLKEIGKEAVKAWYCKDLKSYRKPDDFCSYGERRTDNERKAD